MFAVLLTSIVLAIAVLMLGLSVLLRNKKDPTNLIFFVICTLVSAWSVVFEWTFYVFDSSASANGQSLLRVLNRSSFVLGLLLVFTGVLFTYYFPVRRPKSIIKIFTPLVILTGVLSATRLIAGKIAVVNDKYQIPSGRMTWLYLLTMGIGIAIITYNMATRKRHLSQLQKGQRGLLRTGFITSLLVGVLLAVVAPIIFPNLKIDALSPIALLFFLVPVASAIRSYRLFDFRAVLARSLAYVLVITVLSLLFIGIGLLASVLFTNSLDSLHAKTIATYFIISILLAISFGPLRHFFDRVTNRLFFRDVYDSQELLNELNRSLVTTVGLEDILLKSGKIIGSAIKTEQCAFAIRETDEPLRLVGDSPGYYPEKALTHLVSSIIRSPSKIVVADDLETEKHQLKELMQAANVTVLVKLEGKTADRHQHPGYILLGSKKSGGLYSAQDITVLGIIADELVIAIQNSLRFEEIQRFNITLQEKIEEATKQLRQANHRLRELDQTKDEFISMASHQLRTPLTTIKGYLSMVLEGDAGKVTQDEKKMIQQAFDSAERMVFLIADLLNVSRLQSGKFVIENKPTDLAKMVGDEISQLKETAANHHLTINYKKPENFPLLNLDDNKIRQVVMNFMDNAIYYTPAGGSIEVALETTEHEISYSVTDTGLGVPKDEQHHLFSKFYRAGNARKMRPDGTGLGLFMAKKVIAAQGGAVIFHSIEGKGSTFGFSFPRARMEVKGDIPKAAEPKAEPERALTR